MKVRIVTAKQRYGCSSTVRMADVEGEGGDMYSRWRTCGADIAPGQQHATFQEYGTTQRCCMECAKARGLVE